MRYRIYSDNRHLIFPCLGYYAGWYDNQEEGLKLLEELKTKNPTTLFELHGFRGDTLLLVINLQI